MATGGVPRGRGPPAAPQSAGCCSEGYVFPSCFSPPGGPPSTRLAECRAGVAPGSPVGDGLLRGGQIIGEGPLETTDIGLRGPVVATAGRSSGNWCACTPGGVEGPTLGCQCLNRPCSAILPGLLVLAGWFSSLLAWCPGALAELPRRAGLRRRRQRRRRRRRRRQATTTTATTTTTTTTTAAAAAAAVAAATTTLGRRARRGAERRNGRQRGERRREEAKAGGVPTPGRAPKVGAGLKGPSGEGARCGGAAQEGEDRDRVRRRRSSGQGRDLPRQEKEEAREGSRWGRQRRNGYGPPGRRGPQS